MPPRKKKPEVAEQGSNLPEVINKKSEIELSEESRKKQDMLSLEKFTATLNIPPTANRIATHEGRPYIPISFVEKDLFKMYFGLVQYEIISFSQILNEFVVHARIRVFHPVIKQWLNYDGIGCGMFQQTAGTPIEEFFKYKLKNGGKLTVPNAYAEAIKNGAKKIGKRFGSDLGRKFEDNYQGFIKESPEVTEGTDAEILNK